MERKYRVPSPSEVIALVGDNFIVDHLFHNFKKYSKLKTYQFDCVGDIDHRIDYIFDCSFNERSQNDVLKYAVENDVKKVILLNHWKKYIAEFKNLVVVQAVVPDVYGEEHMSFSRPGSGNYYESPISYCTLICESIRRIHEAKTGFVPNVYIQYGEETLKYLYVENLYQPIQYILDNIHETSEYEIYDEYRNVGVVLDIIRDVLEYKGTVHFENTRTSYNKPLKKLPYQHEYKSFTSNIRTIYKFLVYNHERFKNLY